MKKARFPFLGVVLFFLITLFFYPAFSQTFTAKYDISMTERSKGFYEYLPDGYSSGNQRYPLIIFVHGTGEKGDGSSDDLPKVLVNGTPNQISKGTFPKSFSVKGKTFSFIVLTPQFTAWPASSDIQNIIDYAIRNYRVDESRIYLTGLSMGGGVVWDYASASVANGERLAAIVPICGASGPNSTKCNNMAIADLPVWATHNDGDGTVPVSNTIGYVNGINNSKVPPTPRAKMTIFNASGHNAWSRTYDLNFKENGLNVYEWMLQFQSHSVLSVAELVFAVRESNGLASLNWSATEEPDNLGFILERSVNGTLFDSIAFVPSRGANGGHYFFTDQNTVTGKSFYRLKMVSASGKVDYSNVAAIEINGVSEASVFPNPVGAVMNFRTAHDLSDAILRIFDISGRAVQETVISGAGNHPLTLNIPAGVYSAVLIENGKVTFRQSFIKQAK